MAGLSGTGLEILSQADIVVEMQAAFRARFGASANVDIENPDSVLGREIAAMSEREAVLWELALALWNMLDVRTAGGAVLDLLADVVGLTRNAATRTTVTLTVDGTNGTIIGTGSRAATAGGVEVETLAPVTLTAGVDTVAARALIAGAVPIAAGAITTIVTPIAGWTSVTNSADGVTGSDRETDSALRERVLLASSIVAVSPVDGMLAALLDIDEVQAASVQQNEESFPVGGLPANSIAVTVFGSGIDTAELAAVIWSRKGAGIKSAGAIELTTQDALGNDVTVRYSTASVIQIEVEVTVETSVESGYPPDGESQIQTAVGVYANALTMGGDVYPFKISAAVAALNLLGVTDIDIRVRRAGDAFTTDNLVLTPFEVGRMTDPSTAVTVIEV